MGGHIIPRNTDFVPIDSKHLSRPGRRQLAQKLRFEYRWPIRRIANRLGITPQATRRLLHRYCKTIPNPPAAPPRVRCRYVRLISLSTEYYL